MSPSTRRTPDGPPRAKRGRQLIGRTSSAAGIGSLAALTMVTNEKGIAALLVIASIIFTLHLVIAAVLTAVASRIALHAVKAGQDPVRLIQVLISLLRATR
jgi:hypothetical protein